MNPGRERVKDVFYAAVELPPESREAYVRSTAAGDLNLIEEILSLLRYDPGPSIPQGLGFPPLAAEQDPMDRQDSPFSEPPPGSTATPVEQAAGIAARIAPPSEQRATHSFVEKVGSYRVLECIGEGGMGVVYRAYDESLRRFVALKTLQRTNPKTLDRFKREFRSFADIVHPNLVSLYELISVRDRWWFSMELIEGRPFLAYLAGDYTAGFQDSPPRRAAWIERLRAAFRQLASGVAALHSAGKFHRDLKPNNVLVTEDRRVVILDFGLGAERDLAGLHQTTDDHVLGSIAYMSPEQAALRGRISAASDWYSVGVMLYQALTGRLPFQGDPLDILCAKKEREPESPASVAPAIPDDLNALCIGLLRTKPADRPDGPAILACFGAESDTRSEMEISGATPAILARFGAESDTVPGAGQSSARDAFFVGRSEELAVLRDAFETMRSTKEPVIVYIRGASGEGKSALAHRFLDEAARYPGALVLAGRCHENELVPFKALDNLIDSLVRHLRQLSPMEQSKVMPRDIRSLARVFPAFGRVYDIADAPTVEAEEMNQPELRRRGALSLREMLARIGDRNHLVLFIDDLHWGDIDSASLLIDLVTPTPSYPPAFLGICCYRSEDEDNSACLNYLKEWQGRAALKHARPPITLKQLAEDETRELARRLIGFSQDRTDAFAEEIARESAGRPFLVYELIEHVKALKDGQAPRRTASLEDVLWPRIEALPDAGRALLEIVAIAGRPIDIADACQAACVGADDRAVLRPLRAARLIRGAPGGAGHRIEVYHDRVRKLVLDRLPEALKRDRHCRFADALAASNPNDAEARAHHLHQGGKPEEAARYYNEAADAAAKALAFEHAADLYRRALTLGARDAAQSRALRARLGDALNYAGRGHDAAREYLAAAEHSDPVWSLDLQHKAALALLTSGHVDEGLSCLRPVLKDVGIRLAGTPWRALLSLLARRIEIRFRGTGFTERSEESIGPEALRPVDIGWSVVLGLSVIDPIRGADFQARNLLLALRAGEPFRVVRALAVEAGHLASSGGVARANIILSEAERLAAALDRPYANGMVELARGTIAYFDEIWKNSLASCERAAEIFRQRCPGTTWEVDTANAFALWSLVKMGEIGELARRCPGLLKEARERGDLYAATNLSTHIMGLVRLAAGEAANAREELDRVMAGWSQKGYHVQHHDALLAFVPIELYCGNPSDAWTRVREEWAAFRWSLLSHIPELRIEMLQLRSYCALAMAAAPNGRNRFLAVAARDARRLGKETLPRAAAVADYVRGSIAFLEGDPSTARVWLAKAASGFDRIHAKLYANVTRMRLADIRGCENASEIRNAAGEWFRQQGIQDPERMTEAYAPGFRA
jgi:serine/threonine protein kinase